MNARDELGFERRLEDPARLRDREVAAVAEHVAEPCSCNMRVGAPARHLLGVGPEPGASVGGLGVGGQEGDLDPRQVFAIAEALEDARSLELALALEVIARLRLDGGGAALEPSTQPVRGRLLERCRSRGPRGVDGGHDASARLLVRDVAEQVEGLLSLTPAPCDVLVVIADHGGLLDDACAGAREQAADVVQAPHFETTVLPPTITLVTSRAVQQNMRLPRSICRH